MSTANNNSRGEATDKPASSVRQTVHLLALRVLGLAANGITLLYMGSVLPAEDFGRYSFFLGFFALTLLLFEGGIFVSAARVAGFSNEVEQRRLSGSLLLLSLPLYGVYLAFVFGAVAIANQLDKVYFDAALMPAIAFGPAILIHYGLVQVSIGANRVGLLGMLRSLPFLVFMPVVFAMSWTGTLTYANAALAFTASFFLSLLVAAIMLKPRFDRVMHAFKRIREHLRFGFDVYLSRIIAQGVYKLDVPLVALFLDFEQLGYYSLARAFVMPLTLIGQTFASTRYKEYSTAVAIPDAQRRTIYLRGAVAGFAPVLMGAGLLQLFFADKPPSCFITVQILGLRVFFQFVYPIYNMFLLAGGRAKSLRNAAAVTCGMNLLLYITLIPAFGIYGAAMADALDCGVYYLYMLWAYRIAVREKKSKSEHTATSSEQPTDSLARAA